jgi:hypothetical protein
MTRKRRAMGAAEREVHSIAAKRAGCGQWMKGRKHSIETLERIQATRLRGANNPGWKGDGVGYSALHGWVRRALGSPSCCERCGTTKAKRYEWANKSLQYRRDLTDWERLCASCHRKDGFVRGEYQPLILKGGKTGRVPHSAFKKGEHPSPATEFKPGQKPHNAYLTDRICEQCGRSFRPLDATRKFCCRPCYWASMRSQT